MNAPADRRSVSPPIRSSNSSAPNSVVCASPAYLTAHGTPAHPDDLAATLAEVNLMSLCGLHRSLRGALIGQFAAVELTSSPGSTRIVRGMRRIGLPEAAVAFYAEHVEAVVRTAIDGFRAETTGVTSGTR